jgi:hypothetical protein
MGCILRAISGIIKGMTIKKTVKKTSASTVAGPGGATIADRFRLDLPEESVKKSPTGAGTKLTFFVGLISLALAGAVTVMLYMHWEFLKNL